jgi:hypothetical protein
VFVDNCVLANGEVEIAKVQAGATNDGVVSAWLSTTWNYSWLAHDGAIAAIAICNPQFIAVNTKLEVRFRHGSSWVRNHNEVLEFFTLSGGRHAAKQTTLSYLNTVAVAQSDREGHHGSQFVFCCEPRGFYYPLGWGFKEFREVNTLDLLNNVC